MCARVALFNIHHAKIMIFLIMLKKSILIYFYNNICITEAPLSFNEVCYRMKTDLENVEFQRNIKLKWNSLSLKSIMSANVEKST